jgi:hypothetical protein
MSDSRFKDRFDEWQYFVFRLVLFILFLTLAYRMLDDELHITSFISGKLGY